MPKAQDEGNAARPNIWNPTDFAFALRELRQEFPLHSIEALIAALQAAGEKLPAASGRVRLVQFAREQARAQ